MMILKTTKTALIVACVLPTYLHAGSSFYGTFELGNSAGRFRNIEALAPNIDISSANVVDDKDNAIYSGIAIGYNWQSTPLRSEVQYSMFGSQKFTDDMFFNGTEPERTTVKVKQDLLMFNLLYDYKTKSTNFVPYIGGGIGISKTRVSATQIDNPPEPGRSATFAKKSDTNFAWNLVVGANFHYTKPTIFGIGYRYTDAGRVTTDNNCLGTDAFICDANETHSADFNSHLFFVRISHYFE